eukprot:768548-Hanusia_phi.AAC.9
MPRDGREGRRDERVRTVVRQVGQSGQVGVLCELKKARGAWETRGAREFCQLRTLAAGSSRCTRSASMLALSVKIN